jgi:hypothetical protein
VVLFPKETKDFSFAKASRRALVGTTQLFIKRDPLAYLVPSCKVGGIVPLHPNMVHGI